MISKAIKLTAFWLKFASLTRKRLYDVEDFAYKLVLMRLPALGSHGTSRNRGSFEVRERTMGTRLFLRDLPIGFVKYFKD